LRIWLGEAPNVTPNLEALSIIDSFEKDAKVNFENLELPESFA
jgi:hypothetical protein